MGPTPPEIPEQLRQFEFVLVRAGTKEPFEKDWQRKPYSWDDQTLRNHLMQGGNYGCKGGNGHVIIDSDDPEVSKLVVENLPATFRVKSPGHGGLHSYFDYESDNEPRDIPLLDKSRPIDRQNLGHIRGKGIVVGPGCRHPNGKLYEIVDDRPLARVTEDELLGVLAPYLAGKAKIAEAREARVHGLQDDINIRQLVDLTKFKHQSHEYRGPHPLHGSSTGDNLAVNPDLNLWHCFRHGTGGGGWSLLAVMERVIDCEDAVTGGLRGKLFDNTRRYAVERGLIKKPAPPKLQMLAENPAVPPTGLTEATKPDEAAEALLQLFRILCLSDTDEILLYKDGVYRTGAEGTLARTLEDNFHGAQLDHVSNNHFHAEVLGHLRRRTYVSRAEFDKDPNILNLKNGLLDLRTFELSPHSPDYLSLVQLPVTYDAEAQCPQFTKFLSEVTYPEDEPSLQEFCGVTLWKQPYQTALLTIGEGDNGKSTFLRVLASLHGPENTSAVSLQELEIDRFAKADLYGKNVNIYADLPDVALRSTGQFKQLTGGDAVRAQRKHQQSFTFVPWIKLIFSCNKIPAVPEDTIAFFRRWHIVTFPNVFLGREDKDLLGKLTSEVELSGFLNWCIEGLKRLKANGWRLSDAKSVEQTRQEYVRRSDPVQAFVMDCTRAEPETEIPKDSLYEAFKEYCETHKLPAAYRDQFFRRLSKHATVTTTRPRIESNRAWSVKGLALKAREDWGKSEDDEDRQDQSQVGEDLYELVLKTVTRLTKENGEARRADLEAALKDRLTSELIESWMKRLTADGMIVTIDWGRWRSLR